MASVTYDHVYKRFGDVVAVNDLDIKIEDKEFLVLVGPSGCGKTTALRLLAGLEEISEGQIYIGDQIVNDVAPKDRDIAMVFQSYALYPHMTVYDNMAFGLKAAQDTQRTSSTSAYRKLLSQPGNRPCSGPPPAPAFRWSASACCSGPSHRA
jgi:ABC-type sugar transport system ATPase subunit